ncbi:MAG: dihydropteroate synthase [Bacteroidales bacterium]|nr:dihydropteroate synthase [Bacteroidales bacterium]
MGIVNLTDDSYFAESRCGDIDAAIERTRQLLDEGATIIDVGACSTRPGALPVGEDEEWNRLEPFLCAFVAEFPDVRLSIDTYWSSVVRRAYALVGDFIVNDISAGEADGRMLSTVGELGLEYVAMHMRGNSLSMQSLTDYDSVTDDVFAYFQKFSQRAEKVGIRKWILDPGFGFAKTIDQNYQLLRELDTFNNMICTDGSAPRLLVGLSRKSMIYKRFNITPEEALPATQVLHLKSLMAGADILRVHDVAEAVRTVDLYRILFL